MDQSIVIIFTINSLRNIFPDMQYSGKLTQLLACIKNCKITAMNLMRDFSFRVNAFRSIAWALKYEKKCLKKFPYTYSHWPINMANVYIALRNYWNNNKNIQLTNCPINKHKRHVWNWSYRDLLGDTSWTNTCKQLLNFWPSWK